VKAVSTKPQERIGGGWQLLKPETAADRPKLMRSTVPTWEPWVWAVTQKARWVRLERTAAA
jgi:hypothetical protein